MNIKELHKIVCDEKNEIIKKAELAKSLNYSREYVGQLFKNEQKQVSLDKIEQCAKYFSISMAVFTKNLNNAPQNEHAPEEILQIIEKVYSIDKKDMPTIETILASGRVRSLVKTLIKSLNGDTEATEALISILKMPELAKTFIE